MAGRSSCVPANLAVFAAGIVSPTALETYKDDFSNHAAGTGPFKLDHWTKDVELVFVANDQYWGGRPKLDKVIWRTIAEDTVKLQELTTGSIDVANQLDFKDIDTVKNDANLQVVSGDLLERAVPGRQPGGQAVRQARRCGRRCSTRSTSRTSPTSSSTGTTPSGRVRSRPVCSGTTRRWPPPIPTIPEKAKSLISESGVGDVSFDLYNRTNSVWPLIGQLIQADLEAVGIKANIVSLEDAEFFSQLGTGKVGGLPERLDVGQRRSGQHDLLALLGAAGGDPAGLQERPGQRAEHAGAGGGRPGQAGRVLCRDAAS